MSKPLVIITGASSGIGAGLAKLFSQQGYPLGLLARDFQAMEDLHLPNSLCIKTDVTDIHQVRSAIEAAEKKFGPVGCLINNAGAASMGFTDLPHEAHEIMVQVNIMGVINTIETVLPGMQERKAGTIINISSIADRNSRPNLPTYAATKAAVKSLSESLRMGNAKYGIRVCNVAPAKIRTPMVICNNLNANSV